MGNENFDENVKKEMKYIKWPRPSKVCSELLSVAVGAAVVSMLIAASDEISKLVINLIGMLR